MIKLREILGYRQRMSLSLLLEIHPTTQPSADNA